MTRTDRAQSELLGYVLAFSIVITSVGVVYVGGFGAVQDLSGTEQTSNSEHAFEVLADGVETIRTGEAPIHASSLNLRGGSIGLAESSSVRVQVSATGFDERIAVGRLQYASEEGTVVFQSGAVLSDRGNWSVVSPPPTTCSDDLAAVPVVQLRGNASVGGETVVQIVSRVENRTLLYPGNYSGGAGPTNVTLTPPNDTRRAWGDWLRDAGWSDADGDGAYKCTGVDRAFVSRVTVAVTVRS